MALRRSLTMPLPMRIVFGSAYPLMMPTLRFSKEIRLRQNAHLAVLAHVRGNFETRANYIKRLPADKLNEVLEIIMRNSLQA